MSNRLRSATSPYLLQHRDNPVHWQEWGEEAFAEARRRNVPVLLSVGYAACHWCHVMAHESFEDETVAAVLNDRFVSVKVDREERPDIDAAYMSAVTATTGHGGWPMTVFLTPDGEPFFCGTYFPRDHFLRVLAALDEAWRTREDEVRASGTHIATSLADALRAPTPYAVEPGALDSAVDLLARQFDRVAGGFGGAPKFPPSMVLEFLLRHHARTGDASRSRHGLPHSRGDGPQRHVRPARRRLRPLRRRRRLGRAALREDALRQRPPPSRLHDVVEGHSRPPRRTHRSRDG